MSFSAHSAFLCDRLLNMFCSAAYKLAPPFGHIKVELCPGLESNSWTKSAKPQCLCGIILFVLLYRNHLFCELCLLLSYSRQTFLNQCSCNVIIRIRAQVIPKNANSGGIHGKKAKEPVSFAFYTYSRRLLAQFRSARLMPASSQKRVSSTGLLSSSQKWFIVSSGCIWPASVSSAARNSFTETLFSVSNCAVFPSR